MDNKKTKIVLYKLSKFKKSWMKKKANRIVLIMNDVINSTEFENRVCDFDFTDRRYRFSEKDNWKRISSNAEILDILKKGNEQFSVRKDDFTWNLKIRLGRYLRQVGRRERDLIITQNWFFKPKGNDKLVAAHWFHEYCHVIGFYHDYKDTIRRPNSVPYGIGQIVKDCLGVK